MPKIQSRRHRANRAEPFETMVVEKEEANVLPAEVEEEEEGSNRAVYKRHQTEWRKMKHQVAQLKKQRKALNKKQREKKKEISKEIKHLIASMRAKHEQELKELGIVAPATQDDEDLMMDDDE
jgi:hypothetical protein